MSNIHIGFVVDNGYVKYMSVVIASILKNSKTDEDFCFHVINEGSITETNKKKINKLKKIKNFDIKYYAQSTELHHEQRTDTRADIPMVTNYRLMISSILKDIDKIIFMDADLIVTDSFSELYNTNIDDYYMASCPWPPEAQDKKYNHSISLPDNVLYCNTGVMLANLKKWREDNIEQKLFADEQKHRGIYRFYDQCIFNITFCEKTLYLNQKWNFRPGIWNNKILEKQDEYKDAFLSPVVIHWADPVKPWQSRNVKYFDEYKKYAKLTPFYKEIYKNLNKKELKNTVQSIFSIKNTYSGTKKYKRISILGIKLNINIKSNRPTQLPRLEVHVVDHCNLNCRGCTHFCNIAPEKFVKVEDFERDLREVAKKITIGELKILGGEPLLHPELPQFLYKAREIFPNTKILLTSNLILLDTMKDDFWSAMKDNNISFQFTKYPTMNNKFVHYLDLIAEQGITLDNIHVANEFWLMRNPKGDSDPLYEYNHCCDAYCRQLRDGRLYICPDACYMDYYNAYFNKNIPVDKGIDIYNHTGEEIYKYLTTPKETCKFCTSKKIVPWSQSKKEVDEWDAV